MPTLDPKFEIGGVHGDTEPAAQARAAYAAGFTGAAAAALVLRGTTPAQFTAALAEAREIRGVARICASGTGVDIDTAVNDAVIKGIPLATVRKDIIDLMARQDEDSHIDTSPRAAAAGKTADVYAQRAAQIDASRGKNG